MVCPPFRPPFRPEFRPGFARGSPGVRPPPARSFNGVPGDGFFFFIFYSPAATKWSLLFNCQLSAASSFNNKSVTRRRRRGRRGGEGQQHAPSIHPLPITNKQAQRRHWLHFVSAPHRAEIPLSAAFRIALELFISCWSHYHCLWSEQRSGRFPAIMWPMTIKNSWNRSLRNKWRRGRGEWVNE